MLVREQYDSAIISYQEALKYKNYVNINKQIENSLKC